MISDDDIRDIAKQDVRSVAWVCFTMACRITDSFVDYVEARWEDVRTLHNIERADLEAAKPFFGDEFDAACCAHVRAMFA